MKSIWQNLKKFEQKGWHFPIFLLGLMAIAYALYITRLGFYWDDWTQLLVFRLYGSQGYWAYFASDRPTSAWTHALLVPILGFKPLHWQIFTLLMRWLTVIGMWYSLRLIWPKYGRTITAAAFLFAVYPAFIQQAPSVAFHQHWLQFALYFASLICMIKSVRSGKLKWGWLLGSMLLQVLQLSITEFYAGIELIRPVILWILLSQEKRENKRLLRTFFYWLPYLLLLSGFTIWRLFLSAISSNQPSLLYSLQTNPLDTVVNLLNLVITDQIYIVISNWARVFRLDFTIYSESLILISWLAAVLVAFLLWRYFAALPANQSEDKLSRKQMLLIGGLITLVGPAPIWLASKNMLVDDDFHVDRFAIASMWGISLIIVIMLEYIIREWKKTALAIAILVAVSSALQIRVAGDYSNIWQDQKSFYWQLLWRAPFIEPETALVSKDTLISHQELFSTASAINHLYPQSAVDGKLAYWMYRLTPTFDTIDIVDNPSFYTQHRIYQFNGSLNNSLVIQYDPQISPCLWVLSAVDEHNPQVPNIVQQAAVHSNLDRIEEQPHNAAGYPPIEMIGEEPAHDWCYLYQKAELAVQASQWQDILGLMNQANQMGYTPGDDKTHPREWLPMVRALIADGQLEKAGEISQVLINENIHNRTMVCSVWMDKSDLEDDGLNHSDWYEQFHCDAELRFK